MKIKEKSEIKKLLIILIFVCTGMRLYATEIKELEFRNQPLSDVLMSLGAIAEVSVIPDETITGLVTYRFTDTNFEEALEILSKQYDFFYSVDERQIYHASKFFYSFNSDKNLITFKTSNIEISLILQAFSKAIGKTVLFDPMPSEKLTLNSTDIPPEKLLAIILQRFPNYEFKLDNDYYYIKRKANDTPPSAQRSIGLIKHSENDFSIDLDRGDLIQILNKLFDDNRREYVFLYKANSILQNLHYSHKNFDQLLRLILEQSSGGFTISEGIYYIYELNRQEILKKYKTSVYIPLKYITAGDIPELLPGNLSSNSFYKLDNNRNGIILSGSIEEITPISDYINSIDQPVLDKEYYRYDANYIEVPALLEMLPGRLISPSPMVLPGGKSFVLRLSKDQKKEFDYLIDKIDRPAMSTFITFRYIKAEEFLKAIPPPFTSENFKLTGSESSLYFEGTNKQIELLNDKLKEIDKPKPQVRYKLLIIQSQEGNSSDWEFSIGANPSESTDSTMFMGALGNLLSLDFDIISTFGYLFALKINASLKANTSKILADTTLHGLSGETVKFQNTSTYRYQDTEVDDEGNLQQTGITREISTGLFLDVTGWVSGDDMVTMKIASTLSKKGTSTSSSDSLPPTSERIVNTHVRTPSGKPIVISGLMQQETSITTNKVPILGDIPLLRLLFTSTSESVENTELTIYIVPYIERSIPEETEPSIEIKRLFNKFIVNKDRS
ncbi:MAG: hypothetical protein L3J12_05065 [Spirochaetales bacterium]|nr:hypothetical protein [Spirochaetales bacterium]